MIRGSELAGNVLQSMRGRIPAMRVTTASGECPRILFRGELTIRGQRNPTVYVDGALMSDTCILNEISANDVDYIEVYPGGNTPHGNLQRNPFGVILIVRRKE